MSHRTIVSVEVSSVEYPCVLPLKEWINARCGIFQGEGWEPVIARVYVSASQLDNMKTNIPTVMDGTVPCAIRIECATNLSEISPDPGYVKDVTAEIFYLAKITTYIKARRETVYCLEFATEQQWWDGYSIEGIFNNIGVAGLDQVDGDPLDSHEDVIGDFFTDIGISGGRRSITMPGGQTYIPLTVDCGGANAALITQRLLTPVRLAMFEDIYDAANGGKFYVSQAEDVTPADVSDFEDTCINGDDDANAFQIANPIPSNVRVYFGDDNTGMDDSRFEYRDYSVPGGSIGPTDTVALHCMERPIDESGTTYDNDLQTIADELGAAYISNAEIKDRRYQFAGHIGVPTTAAFARMRSSVRKREVTVSWEGVFTTMLFGSIEYYIAHRPGEIASPEGYTVRFRSDGAVDFHSNSEIPWCEVTGVSSIATHRWDYMVMDGDYVADAWVVGTNTFNNVKCSFEDGNTGGAIEGSGFNFTPWTSGSRDLVLTDETLVGEAELLPLGIGAITHLYEVDGGYRLDAPNDTEHYYIGS